MKCTIQVIITQTMGGRTQRREVASLKNPASKYCQQDIPHRSPECSSEPWSGQVMG
jgi:hypothetical protein